MKNMTMLKSKVHVWFSFGMVSLVDILEMSVGILNEKVEKT